MYGIYALCSPSSANEPEYRNKHPIISILNNREKCFIFTYRLPMSGEGHFERERVYISITLYVYGLCHGAFWLC